MINFEKTTAESFRKKSNKILGIFTKTREDLVALNQEQESYRESVVKKIEELEAEKKAVSANIRENSSIINKIDDLLK